MAKVSSGRWAVVVKDTGVVSEIKLMQNGMEPELRNDQKDRYELIELDNDDVAVGMVRGGKGKNGFAWPEGHENAGAGAIGATSYEGDKSRGTKVPKAAKAEKPTPQPEEVKPQPAQQAKVAAAAR